MSDVVSEFYRRFPYPAVDTELSRPLPDQFSLLTLNYLLRRPPDKAIPETARIWVAGCGTRQAVQVALRFPRAEVIGTDVSATSLANSQRVAEAVGVAERVQLEEADLVDARYEDAFDLVFCTGVLHHLADPAAGAARIRRSLRRHGASVWMVYSEIHRRPFVTFQRCLEALGPYGDLGARLRAARDLLRDVLGNEANTPLHSDLEGLDRLAEEDLPTFADTLVHPRETSFSPATLRSFVAAAGLRFVSWRYPAFWDPVVYLRDPVLRERAAALEALEKEMLIFRLGGYGSPFLDLLVERDDAPPRAPVRLPAMKPLLSQGTEIRSVSGDRVGRPRRRKPFHLHKERILVTLAREGGAHQRRWAIPRGALALLETFDGEVTLTEIADRLGPGVGMEHLEAFVKALLPDQMGLVAPA